MVVCVCVHACVHVCVMIAVSELVDVWYRVILDLGLF